MTEKKLKNPILTAILETAPIFGNRKYAIFGVGPHNGGCLWWSSFHNDAAKSPTGMAICPFCGGPLQEIDLLQFLYNAEQTPSLYGPRGIQTLLDAHHRNAQTCRTAWTRYNVRIKEKDEV